VVRGGSWNNNRNNGRCAVRNRNNPDNSNNNNGFRCVSHAFLRMPAMPRVARWRTAYRADAGRGFERRRGLSLAGVCAKRRANI